MSYQGDFTVGQTLDIDFNSTNVFGEPVTIASPEARVFKDGDTSGVLTGVSLTIDHGGVTGKNHLRVVMADAFYASASEYVATLSDGDVDGVPVNGTVLASWSIQNRAGAALGPTASSRYRLGGYADGLTLYIVVRRESDELVWNVSAYEAYNASNWGSYLFPMTGAGGGSYFLPFPSSIPEDLVHIFSFMQVGGTASFADDVLIRHETAYWNGSQLIFALGGGTGGGTGSGSGDDEEWDKFLTAHNFAGTFGGLVQSMNTELNLVRPAITTAKNEILVAFDDVESETDAATRHSATQLKLDVVQNQIINEDYCEPGIPEPGGCGPLFDDVDCSHWLSIM